MGIVDFFERKMVITEEEARELRTRIRIEPKGITVQDVLSVFPGAKIVPANQPKTCPHCEGNLHAKIVPCLWPDGRETLVCHACGRELGAKQLAKVIRLSARIHPLKSLEGRRGCVLCRGCYRPMTVSILNGGYDWHCERCAIVWR